MQVINWLISNILDVPCVFMALIAAVGSLLQKKKIPEVIEAALLTAVGYTIFNCSMEFIFGPIGTFNSVLQTGFSVEWGITPNSDGMIALASSFGYLAANMMQIFIVAWFIHIMIVKFFHNRFKVVYLTIHAMLDMVAMSMLFWNLAMGLKGVWMYVACVASCVLYWTLTPMLCYKDCMEISDGQFALGHLQAIGCWLAARIAPFFGDPEKDDAENLRLPDWLQMFSSTTLNMAISMPLLFIVLAAIALIIGNAETIAIIEGVTGGQNFVFYFFVQGITFAAGITILLTGMRMFLGSLIPAFQGFTEKLLPGVAPAVDLAAFFSYAPTAAMFGFIGYAVAGIIVAVAALALHTEIFVFPFIAGALFDGGVIAVFANHKGGWKAALAAGLITGLVMHIGSGIYASYIPEVLESGNSASNFDPTFLYHKGPVFAYV